jgi:hypothetical protein
LREKRVNVFEERIFEIILDPKMDKLTGTFRKLNNFELHYLHPPSRCIYDDRVKVYEMGRACDTHCREEKRLQVCGGKALRK